VGEPAPLPAGTVTFSFLFTDLEGGTGPQQAHPDAYGAAVRRHHDLLQGAAEGHGGVVFETVGDAVYAAFARPTAAVAAPAGRRPLHREPWGATGPLRARMGIYLGEVDVYPAPGAARGARYLGLPLVRCARLTATAHGGQTVLSEAATALVRDALPPGAGLRDFGEHRLKDLSGPERVAQLLHSELPADFPPLRSLDTLTGAGSRWC
jgi:class 3 adenylate cyclase